MLRKIIEYQEAKDAGPHCARAPRLRICFLSLCCGTLMARKLSGKEQRERDLEAEKSRLAADKAR